MLKVKVVPGASRDRIAGKYGDGIKVQVSAPPEKGKANAAAAHLLARWLGIKPNQLELVAGIASANKQFRINGLTASALAAKLAELP
jgi:hypothetical protein